jgi:hypothetical protein
VNEDTIGELGALDALLAPAGPAAWAWMTRVQRQLEREWPEQFVFRHDTSLENLVRWLEESAIEREEGILPRIEFDDDRAGPRMVAEGGQLAFRWQGDFYRALSVLCRGRRSDETCTWIVCSGRAAGEALVDAVGRHARVRRSRVMVFEEGCWEDAPRLESNLSRYSWESIVLSEGTATRIRSAAELFFRSEQVYRDLGIPWKLGFLLVGPPGTGKTLTTKVLAATCGVPFLYVRGLNSFYENKPDSSTIREMFQGVRERAPCLLCLEDLDSLVTQEVRSTFLNELDGIEEDYRGVLTVATTNHPEQLDAALLHRPSRFDYRFEMALPGEEQRRAFVTIWTQHLVRLGYVDRPERGIQEIVQRSRGMSHAYLKRVLVGIALRMHHLEERGDQAFARLAREEIADASGDRQVARRSETGALELAGGARLGFRQDGDSDATD